MAIITSYKNFDIQVKAKTKIIHNKSGSINLSLLEQKGRVH